MRRRPPGAPGLARTLARARACLQLPGPRQRHAQDRRGRFRGPGVCARALQGDPPRASEGPLSRLPAHRADRGPVTADRAQLRRLGAARPYPNHQVCRPPPALPARADLRPGRRRTRSLDGGRVGGRLHTSDDAARRGARRYVFVGGKLHADDAPVPVHDRGRGKTKTGRLWTYVRDDRLVKSKDTAPVLFRYSPDRREGTSEGAPETVHRHPTGRRLLRLR
jgi:transposase IS66 family protein